VNDQKWYFDSGCTRHMTKDISLLAKVQKVEEVTVSGALGQEKSIVLMEGSKEIQVEIEGQDKVITFNKILYVPTLRTNLISVKSICEKGGVVIFEDDTVTVYKEKERVFGGTLDSTGLYSKQWMFGIRD